MLLRVCSWGQKRPAHTIAARQGTELSEGSGGNSSDFCLVAFAAVDPLRLGAFVSKRPLRACAKIGLHSYRRRVAHLAWCQEYD